MIDQFPLPLPITEDRSPESFIIGIGNRHAYDGLWLWPQWQQPATVLVGPPGSGKSHMAEMWATAARAVFGRGDALEPLLEAAPDSRGPVVVDDADRVAGDGDRETHLFHLFNLAAQPRRGLLLIGDEPPSAWPVGLDDLRSRLRAATVLKVALPDDEMIENLLLKLFSDRQIPIDSGLVGYALKRMERSYDAARDLVERVDQLSLARKSRINNQLVDLAIAAREGDKTWNSD